MINAWLYCLPFISALAGWLLSRWGIALFFKRVQARQKILALQAGNYVAAHFSLNDVTGKLTDAELVNKILPVADEHIEQFLRVKLPAAMPMLSMFISDKLVADMKAIFMVELKELFPAIISQYLSGAASAIAIDKIIAGKAETIDLNKVRLSLRKELTTVALFGALIGFICGIIQILITILL